LRTIHSCFIYTNVICQECNKNRRNGTHVQLDITPFIQMINLLCFFSVSFKKAKFSIKEITIFWIFIQHESPFKFELSIDFQNRILNQHITNSNIFFTLIDGRGIGINFGTQITFTVLEFFFFYSFFFIFYMHEFFVEGKSFE
jgi:hypothetical protein